MMYAEGLGVREDIEGGLSEEGGVGELRAGERDHDAL